MRYRKKPVVIEAVQFKSGEQPYELAQDVIDGCIIYTEAGTMLITTLEGVMEARPGDWIIRGVKGELYPCKPDIFELTYDILTDNNITWDTALTDGIEATEAILQPYDMFKDYMESNFNIAIK